MYIDELSLHPNVELLITQDEIINDLRNNVYLCKKSTLEATLAHVFSFIYIIRFDIIDFTPCLLEAKSSINFLN
jgi:hypothetical protein